MPIIGAVLTVTLNAAEGLLRTLAADPRVEVGDLQKNRLPIVVDTATRQDDEHFWKTLRNRPAALHHEVVLAELSDISNLTHDPR